MKENRDGLISLHMAALKVERYTGDGVAGDKDTALYLLELYPHLHAHMKAKWTGVKGSLTY